MPATALNSTWQRWHDEIELAGKAKGYKDWQTRAKKIIRRYRDDRLGQDGSSDGAVTEVTITARFNILWSNVQTLKPALFAKSPKPVVERRYLDRDDVGRTASVILERALLYELDNGSYRSSVDKAVLDRLLPGRGVVWVRYEPKFSAIPQKTQVDPADKAPEADASAEKDAKAEAGGLEEEVAYECAPVDYVDWKDFGTSPSRTWEEVWYIWKRVYMTREELVKRFGKEKGEKVPLDWTPYQDEKPAGSGLVVPSTNETQKRAKILEIWCKTDRKVYWIAEGWSDEMLDEKDDPLQLEDFWPTPKPLFSTLTNDSLVPVPDYSEYQDQAIELDDLTGRISALTKAIKAAGVYDASVPELQRMLEEGFENKLVPCDNMAEFSQKAGPSGMGVIWMLPLKDLITTLIELYTARDQVKQSLYEITGISDIVRGQASSGGTTATEQRIKGQFASMRLNDMQAEVARFCRDILRIMGEIIAEHYDPMTLYLVSGYEQYAKEQFPPEPPMPPQMGHNGGPPMSSQASPPAPGAPGLPPFPPGAGMQPIMLPPDPKLVAQQKAADMFKRAVDLLRSDKLRGFRIDIETDSLIEPDQQATQQARTELLGAISQFLPQAIEAGTAVPELKPLMARLLMFFLRGFKASRDIESAFEQFIDDVTKEAANPKPKPPSPEEIKANAEKEKQQAETQRMMLDAKLKAEQGQADMAMRQQEMQFKREELSMEFEHAQKMLQLKEREAMLKLGTAQQQASIDNEASARQAALDAEAADHKHELGMEVAEFKAAEARKPKPEARA